MSIDEIVTKIKLEKPEVIYLSGKTSTGKSTLANRLNSEMSYQIIELDQVVEVAVVKKLSLPDPSRVFVEVYRNRSQRDLIDLFVSAAQADIQKLLQNNKRVIVEGAIANPITLKELFAEIPNFSFIYIHPRNLSTYQHNLLSRFVKADRQNRAGLPSAFWALMDEQAFEQFCEDRQITPKLTGIIKQYAALSAKESEVRLKEFREHFNNVEAVEV